MQHTDTSTLTGETVSGRIEMLVHKCCLPCFLNFYSFFKDGIRPSVFWFNPNIHGVKEFRKRKEVLKKFVFKENIKLFEDNFYSLKSFFEHTGCKKNCLECYRLRLKKTARFAKENGFKIFTTTLFSSPMQMHDSIIKAAEEAAKEFEVDYFYYDIRDSYDEKLAKNMGLYTQNYCGCIFSEEERFLGKAKK
ncbi:MAG: hypothetical protein C0601_07635 [Candidatus Muiribacterium halophilum]|uniref:Epoxyqueuosine reductase QueH n=1 Tax=Muiribacterium halophilum TaxID=2053465 RepID=A0A2N5ZFM6_MUIH1|nr:MAG: hypothetical protein C0601_07635 [Candidatus Muirbacterium halophilum]